MVEVKPAEPLEVPPAAALRDVDHAARVWALLRAEGRELHFGRDPGSGRLLIELRNLDGILLRSIAPAEAVEIASGAPCA